MVHIVKGLVCSAVLCSGLFCGQIDGMRPIQMPVNGISNELQDMIRIDNIDGFQKCFILVNNPNFDQFILSACRYGSLKIFKFCFLNGARNNILNLRQGDATALMLALRGGNTEIIRILLQKGFKIDLSVMNDDNINLLYHAYNSSNQDIMTWLEDIYSADFEGNASGLFAIACKNNELDVAMRLVRNYRKHIGPKATLGNKSAIEYAIENGDLKLLDMIFSKRGLGTDINSPVGDLRFPTMSPLEFAIDLQYWPHEHGRLNRKIRNQDCETIAYLLENGADVFAIEAITEEPIICRIADNYGDYDTMNQAHPTWTDTVYELAILYNYIYRKPKYDVNTRFSDGQALINKVNDPYRLKVLLNVPGINIDLPNPSTSDQCLRVFLEGKGDQENLKDVNEMLRILDEHKKNHPQE